MCLVAAARIRARRLRVPFSLCADDVAHIQNVIDAGRCERSGVRFAMQGVGGKQARSPSIDRIVPHLGYVPTNIRIVCFCMNAGMGQWGEKEFREIVTSWLSR